MLGLEGSLSLVPGEPVELTVFVDSIVCEVYVAGEVAMSTRLYDLQGGQWGVFVEQGSARFERIRGSTAG